MSEKIEIIGEGVCIALEVLGYENPLAQDVSDANWLDCRVSITIGDAFQGQFAASFTTSDFVRFREELSTALTELNGTATFVTDEDALRVGVELSKTGRAAVEGIAQTFSPDASLSFSFETDQTFLNQTLQQLNAVVDHFPIKEYPLLTESIVTDRRDAR